MRFARELTVIYDQPVKLTKDQIALRDAIIRAECGIHESKTTEWRQFWCLTHETYDCLTSHGLTNAEIQSDDAVSALTTALSFARRWGGLLSGWLSPGESSKVIIDSVSVIVPEKMLKKQMLNSFNHDWNITCDDAVHVDGDSETMWCIWAVPELREVYRSPWAFDDPHSEKKFEHVGALAMPTRSSVALFEKSKKGRFSWLRRQVGFRDELVYLDADELVMVLSTCRPSKTGALWFEVVSTRNRSLRGWLPTVDLVLLRF